MIIIQLLLAIHILLAIWYTEKTFRQGKEEGEENIKYVIRSNLEVPFICMLFFIMLFKVEYFIVKDIMYQIKIRYSLWKAKKQIFKILKDNNIDISNVEIEIEIEKKEEP